jgi:hypothetical protein
VLRPPATFLQQKWESVVCVKVVGLFGNSKMVTSKREPKRRELLSGWISAREIVCAARAQRDLFSRPKTSLGQGRRRLQGIKPVCQNRSVKSRWPRRILWCRVIWEATWFAFTERNDVNKRLDAARSLAHTLGQEMNVNQRKLLLILASLLHVRNETHARSTPFLTAALPIRTCRLEAGRQVISPREILYVFQPNLAPSFPARGI